MQMRRFIASFLSVVIFSSLSVRGMAERHIAIPLPKLTQQSDTLQADKTSMMRAEDGTSKRCADAASAQEALISLTSEPAAAGVNPTPQVSPTNPPSHSAHHSHRVRNIIIIVALGAALLVGLAAAAK